jgi:1-deoxy-D-xylulose-5-phosphate synthase
MKSSVYDSVKSPDDLKQLNYDEVKTYCQEVREKLLEVTSSNGGHLASNLGVVELTVALHRVFNSPKDKIIFDVGHQCYTHKIITGRKDEIETIRTSGGISGFPKPSESIHDATICGHSSTSISTAFGLASANPDNYVIAVIGDGALTGGLAYEGLNNAGRSKEKLIVILNDNQMSISRDYSAMRRYLTRIRTRRSYFRFKVNLEKVLNKIPLIGRGLSRFLIKLKKMFKNAIYNSNIFEDFGFQYMGPIDGHDSKKLEEMLSVAKGVGRPTLIHVKTVKGKGYSKAESNPESFHGISAFDIDSGEPLSSSNSFSKVFGEELCKIAEKDKKVCAITAAMVSGTGLNDFSKLYKDRFYDSGIAEEHAAAFAGGLATGGMKPVFAVYSTFLQRSYDQLIHDNAIANLPVTFAVDRAGFVGEDGETHQGLYDTAFLNSVPNISVYSPSNFNELRGYLNKVIDEKIFSAIRYPRGNENDNIKDIPYTGNNYDEFFEGDIALITYGREFSNLYDAHEKLLSKGINTKIIKLNQIKPIDDKAVELAIKSKSVYFYEEGIKSGGIGERFASLLLEKGFKGDCEIIAVEDTLFPQISVKESFIKFKLDSNSIVEKVMEKNGAR